MPAGQVVALAAAGESRGTASELARLSLSRLSKPKCGFEIGMNGQWAVKFDQPDENSSCGEYFRADPDMTGPYVNRSATDPAGTVS